MIESGAFLGLDAVVTLDLSNNYITSIVNGAFVGVPNLVEL